MLLQQSSSSRLRGPGLPLLSATLDSPQGLKCLVYQLGCRASSPCWTSLLLLCIMFFFSLSQIFFTGPVAAGYRPQLPSRSPYLVRRRWHARRATRGGPTAARVTGHESPAYWPSYEDLSLIDD